MNMEKQIAHLQNANAPSSEIRLIQESWEIQSILYGSALKDLDKIMKLIKSELSNSDKYVKP